MCCISIRRALGTQWIALPALYRHRGSLFNAAGVAHVALAMYSPLEGDNWGECVIQQGHPAPGPNDHCGSTWVRVSPQYLASIGVPIVHGRDLSDQDTATSEPVAVVNQTFVKRFFPKADPIGQHFGIDDPKYSGSFKIVGVFRDFKMNNPRDPIRPVFLRPLSQYISTYKEPVPIATEKASMYANAILIDFARTPETAESLLRNALASIDPNVTVVDLKTFDAQIAGNFDQERLLAQLTSLFGVLALVLASVGLYGVMSYFVARRTGEIGIRMALGATRGSVVGVVMRNAGWQVGLGLLLGIPAALLAGHLMASQLYGVGAYDPAAFIGATLVLAACAALAGFIPARRAASIDPMKALRTE